MVNPLATLLGSKQDILLSTTLYTGGNVCRTITWCSLSSLLEWGAQETVR